MAGSGYVVLKRESDGKVRASETRNGRLVGDLLDAFDDVVAVVEGDVFRIAELDHVLLKT